MAWKDEIRKDLGDTMDRRERSMNDKDKLFRSLLNASFQLAEMHQRELGVDGRDYYTELFEKIKDYNKDNRHYDADKIIQFFDNLAGLEFEARDVAKEIERVAIYIRDYAPEGE